MAIQISSGGVSKTYRYYPYDAFYVDANGNVNTSGNGQQVKEAYFNGTKYYPEDYPSGIIALRGIERHPAGVEHAMPEPRHAICAEVYNYGSYELNQYPMKGYEVSWAYLGKNWSGKGTIPVISDPNGGFKVSNDSIYVDQFIFRIKYVPNAVDRSKLDQSSQREFDAITNGLVISTELDDRNQGTASFVDYIGRVVPNYYYPTNFTIESWLYESGEYQYGNHYYWTVHFWINAAYSTNAYDQGHERYVEIFKPNDISALTASDLLPLPS